MIVFRDSAAWLQVNTTLDTAVQVPEGGLTLDVMGYRFTAELVGGAVQLSCPKFAAIELSPSLCFMPGVEGPALPHNFVDLREICLYMNSPAIYEGLC